MLRLLGTVGLAPLLKGAGGTAWAMAVSIAVSLGLTEATDE